MNDLMQEIKIGWYIRTRAGNIIEVLSVDDNKINEWIYPCFVRSYSQNLINLIEIGDAIKIKENLHDNFIKFIENEEMLLALKTYAKNFEIIEILTHEQYERNCFMQGEKR